MKTSSWLRPPAPSFAPGFALCFALIFALTGCGDSDVQEVKQWMAGVQKEARVVVPPISEPKNFIPFAYSGREQTDPFSPDKLATELAKAAQSSGAFRPDMDRRKELLESYPLDTIKMVGTLQKAGAIFALLQIDRAVHQVQAGQHVGQNFGLITSVSERAVSIREIVQDATGDWVERVSKLELQESNGSMK